MSYEASNEDSEGLIAIKFSLTKWIILISPMIPHLAEELWKILGYEKTLVTSQKWPKANLNYIKNTNANIVVQINGKKKLVLNIPKNLNKKQTQELLMKREDVKTLIGNRDIKKTFVVPNKIFSLVI